MNIPKTLKIGGHIYKVEITDKGLNEEDYGELDMETNTIRINSKIPKTNQESTLLHEILHALNTTLDHELLDSLSEQMYQVLKDNKLIK